MKDCCFNTNNHNFFYYRMERSALWRDKRWLCRLGVHKLNWEYQHALNHMPYRDVFSLPCVYCIESKEVSHKAFWAYQNLQVIKEWAK